MSILATYKKRNARGLRAFDIPNHSQLKQVIMKTTSNVAEIWLPVKNYEKFYEVSNLGNVNRLERIVTSKRISYGKNTGFQYLIKKKRLVNSIDRFGYYSVTLCVDGFEKRIKNHKLVMQSFVGERKKGLVVNHINGIKTDNRLVNLEYCTYQENTNHSYRNNLQIKKKGFDSPLCKVSEEDFLKIRESYKSGKTTDQCAEIYNLSSSTIKGYVCGLRFGYPNISRRKRHGST